MFDLVIQQSRHHIGDLAARQPHILCSIFFHSFGALPKAVRLFIASLHNQPMYPKMCLIDIFVDLQLVGWNLKGILFDPRFGGLGGHMGSGWAHSVAYPWFPISSPYGLPLAGFELFGWLHLRFRPSFTYTMTNAALKANALSSGKNQKLFFSETQCSAVYRIVDWNL